MLRGLVDQMFPQHDDDKVVVRSEKWGVVLAGWIGLERTLADGPPRYVPFALPSPLFEHRQRTPSRAADMACSPMMTSSSMISTTGEGRFRRSIGLMRKRAAGLDLSNWQRPTNPSRRGGRGGQAPLRVRTAACPHGRAGFIQICSHVDKPAMSMRAPFKLVPTLREPSAPLI